MHKAICTLALAYLVVSSAPLAFAQSKRVEATNLPDHPFQVDFPAGSQLNLHLRSGGRHQRQQDFSPRGFQGSGKSAGSQGGFRQV